MPRLSPAYPLRSILNKAWCYARAGVRAFGGRAVQYLAAALRQAWAQAKSLAATIAAQRARVLAELAKIRAENSPLGLARQRRADARLEAELQAHRREMAARTAAYNAKWGSGGAVSATRVAA